MTTSYCKLLNFLILFSLTSCVPFQQITCPPGFKPYKEYSLFFGRNGAKNQEVVSDKAWDNFLAKSITRYFPDGLTVFDAKGQWHTPHGKIIHERSKVVVILTNTNTQSTSSSISQIVDTYKKNFAQDSVLTSIKGTCGAF